MTKKLKIILFFSVVCLLVAGVFLARLEISDFFSGYFFNTWKGDETQTQTAQNLVLLNSHSHPEAGEKWVVSFETIGTADLIITPKDSDSIGDLDFASMKCAPSVALAEEGFGQEVNPEIQAGDVLFVPNWSCDGVGIVTHLVNIARKHTLEFQFGNKIAYAYNNPDSVTDTFTDESKIASKSNITVSGGQVKLSTCGSNGTTCTLGSECCSNNCIDGYCCNSACGGNCDRCNVGGSLGTCTNVDSDCTGNCDVCSGGNCAASASLCTGNCDDCSGSGTSFSCVANATYCTGNCDVCSGSGTAYNCAANNSLCNCDTCSGSGTVFNCLNDNVTTACGAGTYGCTGTDCSTTGSGCCTSPNYYETRSKKCTAGTCTGEGCNCYSTACPGTCPI